MREVPLENHQDAIDFANRLITGQIDVVIFLTGVGTRELVKQVERHVDRERFLAAISDIKSVVRGPKPAAALKELGITPTVSVPEPNTWRELLTTLDERLPVANLVVGLQEYGITNPSLIAGLEARGATVVRVRVYDWDLPEDIRPLEENVRRIVDGEVDVAMFTSARQVLNLLKVADDLGLADDLRRRLATASSWHRSARRQARCSAATNLPVDMEPSHPKMGHLVQETAEQAATLLARKRRMQANIAAVSRQSPAASIAPNAEFDADQPIRGTTACFSAPVVASRSTTRLSG